MRGIIFVACLLISAVGLAVAQETPPAWSALADQKFEFSAEGTRIATSVERDDIIVSTPIAHQRTVVLLDAVANTNSGRTLAPVGAVGYFAGAINNEDIWCFPTDQGPWPRVNCFVNRNNTWFLTGPASNQYYPLTIAMSALLEPVTPVRFEERQVVLHPDLRAEYRFRRWGRNGAEVDLLVGGGTLMRGLFHSAPRQPDGSALLTTPVGVVRLQPQGNRGASVTNVSVPIP